MYTYSLSRINTISKILFETIDTNDKNLINKQLNLLHNQQTLSETLLVTTLGETLNSNIIAHLDTHAHNF